MSVGKLNVNLPDLSRAADDYAELQTAAATISPQAVDEVKRIIATHGPMGYPVAVGVVAGLARRQGPLESKAAQFGQYSELFHEHAGTYSDADHEAAQRFEALDFTEGVIQPKPNDDEPSPPYPRLTCWIGSADGDTSVCSEDATEYMYVEDGTWKVRQVDNGLVSELPPRYGEQQALLPSPAAPGSDPFAGVPSGDNQVVWPNPDGTIGGASASPTAS
jgi:Excreted virulence factor EspC, type VII ESX diderm